MLALSAWTGSKPQLARSHWLGHLAGLCSAAFKLAEKVLLDPTQIYQSPSLCLGTIIFTVWRSWFGAQIKRENHHLPIIWSKEWVSQLVGFFPTLTFKSSIETFKLIFKKRRDIAVLIEQERKNLLSSNDKKLIEQEIPYFYSSGIQTVTSHIIGQTLWLPDPFVVYFDQRLSAAHSKCCYCQWNWEWEDHQ